MLGGVGRNPKYAEAGSEGGRERERGKSAQLRCVRLPVNELGGGLL